jgi:hypothetical protein
LAYNVLTQPVVASQVIAARDDDAFFFPQRLGFTGFAADGMWYQAGVQQPSHVASWYLETASDTRGTLQSFPTNALVIISKASVSIYDTSQETLTLWMVFYKNDEYVVPTNFITTGSYSPVSVSWSSGVLSVVLAPDQGAPTQDYGMLSIDFSQDSVAIDTWEPSGAVTPSLNDGSGFTVPPGISIGGGQIVGTGSSPADATQPIVGPTGAFLLQGVFAVNQNTKAAGFGVMNGATRASSTEVFALTFEGTQLIFTTNNTSKVVTVGTPFLPANYVLTAAYLGNGLLSISVFPLGNLGSVQTWNFTNVAVPDQMTTFYVTTASPNDIITQLAYATGYADSRLTVPGHIAIPNHTANSTIATAIALPDAGGTLALLPSTYTNDTPVRWVMVCHDAQSDIMGAFQQAGTLVQTLLNDGYAVVFAQNANPDNYGNQASVSEIRSLLARLTYLFNLRPQPFLIGLGMGALLALNCVSEGAITPPAFCGMSPVLALNTYYAACAADPSGAIEYSAPKAAIEAAYHFAPGGNAAAALAGSDPILEPVTTYTGIPMILWQSSDDPILSADQNASAFAAQINGAGGNVSVISTTGGYLDADEFDGFTVGTFFDTY